MLLLVGVLVVMSLMTMTGCRRPYDKPELYDIEPSQTAFLVPLEGKTSDQATFSSEKMLAQAKVATKRVQIPHRWLQTGRYYWTGRYIGTMRLITVERKPVAREWTADAATGTTAANQAIVGESKESIAVQAGMQCVAQIEEQNATKYLYWYNTKTLDEVMDTEIRAVVEKGFVEQCAKYLLRDEENGMLVHKGDMMAAVRRDVDAYCTPRGISVTVLGLKGEFTYDPLVQKAINDRFVSQQQKSKADNDAYVAQRLKSSGGLEYQLALRKQDIGKELQLKALEKWDGKMPTVTGGGAVPLLDLGALQGSK